MHVDPLEKTWVWLASAIAVTFVAVLIWAAVARGIHPPSNVETIDSASLHLSEEFAEDNLGVHPQPDGSLKVVMVATRYGFYPQHIEVPANTPINFRIATTDVLHGFHVEGTNLATMVIPGFISEVNLAEGFKTTGTKPMFCNEYCGLGHHYMWSRVTITDKAS